MTPQSFVDTFRDTVVAHGWTLTPGQVVDTWRQVIDLVEDGYGDNIYELHNDLAIRNLIEHLLNDERLRELEEFGWVREQVDELDKRFRSLLQPDPVAPNIQRPWWEAHAPRYGGHDLAADFKERYGVTIEER